MVSPSEQGEGGAIQYKENNFLWAVIGQIYFEPITKASGFFPESGSWAAPQKHCTHCIHLDWSHGNWEVQAPRPDTDRIDAWCARRVKWFHRWPGASDLLSVLWNWGRWLRSVQVFAVWQCLGRSCDADRDMAFWEDRAPWAGLQARTPWYLEQMCLPMQWVGMGKREFGTFNVNSL
jgi:hypothetical protein